MTHTPTPWSSRQRDTIIEINGADGVEVVKTSWHSSIRNPSPLKPEAQENIEFIVRACNSHEALVEALRNATDTLEAFLDTFGDLGDRVTAADLADWRAALSTAESKK